LRTPIKIARISEIPPGRGIKVKIGKNTIAVFNYRGQFYAIQNNCPHQNADLANGYIRDGKIYCPMHNWAFDISSGAFDFNKEMHLKTYPLQIKDDFIYFSS
jgi:nitrite reductase (NADH) small subunit